MSIWHGQSGGRKPKRASSQPSAPIAQRDAVYRALVAELGLSDEHRRHLRNDRGIPSTLHDGFATMPTLSLLERKRLACRVEDRAGCGVAGVGGFYKDGASWAVVPLPHDDTGFTPVSALVVPVPDVLVRVQALQLRADGAPPWARRYTMFSSRNWHAGAVSGTPVAVWRPDLYLGGCVLTEGPIKGLVAADRLPSCVLATCGVTLWRPALEVLDSAPRCYPVTIAYDRDALTTAEVWAARESLAATLDARGFAVRVATWEGPKGVDDALLSGVPVFTDPWAPALPAERMRPSVPLAEPSRPDSTPLLVTTR
jgi:hypothetical protein